MDVERSANRVTATVDGQDGWVGDLDSLSLVLNLDQLVALSRAPWGPSVTLRPHSKTHKTSQVADLQRRHSSRGQTYATLGETEVPGRRRV